MDISVEPSRIDPSILVVNLSGEIDHQSLPEVEKKIIPLINDLDNKAFIFNLKGLKYMDSKAIGFFVYAYTTLSHSERHMALVEYDRTIKDIFTIVGLNQVIPHYSTLNEALKKV